MQWYGQGPPQWGPPPWWFYSPPQPPQMIPPVYMKPGKGSKKGSGSQQTGLKQFIETMNEWEKFCEEQEKKRAQKVQPKGPTPNPLFDHAGALKTMLFLSVMSLIIAMFTISGLLAMIKVVPIK